MAVQRYDPPSRSFHLQEAAETIRKVLRQNWERTMGGGIIMLQYLRLSQTAMHNWINPTGFHGSSNDPTVLQWSHHLGRPNRAEYSDSYVGASQVISDGQEQLDRETPTSHAGICWHVVVNNQLFGYISHMDHV